MVKGSCRLIVALVVFPAAFLDAVGLTSTGELIKWRTRREVLEWLDTFVKEPRKSEPAPFALLRPLFVVKAIQVACLKLFGLPPPLKSSSVSLLWNHLSGLRRASPFDLLVHHSGHRGKVEVKALLCNWWHFVSEYWE
jgi:hypothetical protein